MGVIGRRVVVGLREKSRGEGKRNGSFLYYNCMQMYCVLALILRQFDFQAFELLSSI